MLVKQVWLLLIQLSGLALLPLFTLLYCYFFTIVNSFLLTSRLATAAPPAAGANTPGLLQPKLSLRPRPEGEVLLRAAAPGQGLVALALDDVAGEDEQAEQGGRGAGQLLKIVFKNT